jgi:hypothetical protein
MSKITASIDEREMAVRPACSPTEARIARPGAGLQMEGVRRSARAAWLGTMPQSEDVTGGGREGVRAPVHAAQQHLGASTRNIEVIDETGVSFAAVRALYGAR